MSATTMADIALFSKDGRTWHDGSAVADGRPNEAVTKIVIGSLDEKSKGIAVTLPANLADVFPRLTHLHLWGIKGLKTLPVVPAGLKCLDVRRCRALTAIPEVPETEVLDLGWCERLASLPAVPSGLKRLYFNDCASLTRKQVENFLADLTRAASSGSGLAEVDGSRCGAIRTLEEFPRTIEKLVLAGCPNLEAVDGLSEFHQLRHLNLTECRKLQLLPGLPLGPDGRPAVQYLELRGCERLTQFLGQDIGPYDRGNEKRPNVARTFFSRMKFGKELTTRAHAKLLFLGDGRAGKTTLTKRLRWDALAPAEQQDPELQSRLKPRSNEQFTDKVDFGEWTIGLQLDDATATALNQRAAGAQLPRPCDARHSVPGTIHMWDFGGQEIYHQTHRIFASEGSVFVIVWSATEATEAEILRDRPDGFEDAAWIEMNRRRSLDYWLDYVHTLRLEAGRDVKVVLVCTKCGPRELRPPWTERAPRHQDDSLECYYIDSLDERCPDNPEYKKLVASLRKHCGAEAARIGILQPAFYAEAAGFVESQLQRMDRGRPLLVQWETWKEGLKTRHRESRQSALTLDDDDIESITGYLHDSGYIFHLGSGRGNAILIDQREASTRIYRMLLPGGQLSDAIRQNHGVFYGADLEHDDYWKGLASDLERDLLLAFMERCGIVVRLVSKNQHREGKDVYLATERWLLPEYKKVKEQIEAQWRLHEELSSAPVVEEFSFERENISEFDFRALMAHLGRAVGRLARGAQWFREGVQVVDDGPVSWCLQVRWVPAAGDGFLGRVDARLATRREGRQELVQAIENVFSADGSPFAKRVPRRTPTRHDGDSAQPTLDLSEAYFTGSVREWDLAVSSSSKEEQVVRPLVQALERDLAPKGIRVIWYKNDHCRAGDLKEVRKFLDRMGRARCLLLYLSDAFLRHDPERNWYCIYELADAINKVAAGERGIAQTLVLYANGNELNSGNVKEHAERVLSSMADAFLEKYRALPRQTQVQSKEYLDWVAKFNDAASRLGMFFDRRGNQGAYSRIEQREDGSPDFTKVIDDAREALRNS